ncbi:putative methyltransferase YcgJ [bacterium BMS3Abin14]|nr:putative methyltransferase YcgJ [bacterium BMS3Abin14]
MPRDPRNTFSGSAERYFKSTDHQTGPDLDFIRETAGRAMPAVTVDVATGPGHALKAAAPFSGFCLASDLTREMLEVARKHLSGAGLNHVRYAQARAHELPLPDDSADLLTCRIACHHFPSVPEFLREARRALKYNGTFVMIDSIVPSDRDAASFMNRVERLRDPSHVRSFDLNQWREFFRVEGFIVRTVRTFQRTHPFREWGARVGLKGEGLENIEAVFRDAPEGIKEIFRIETGPGGVVVSYTDEKAIFSACRAE